MLTKKEVLEISEKAMGHLALIEKYGLYSQICNDPQVGSLVEQHRQHFMNHFHTLMNLLSPNQSSNFMQNASFSSSRGTNYSQVMSPESIATDCLNSTKYLVLRDAYGSMESATPQVRQAFDRMSREHLQMADEWFRLMNNKGWYTVPQAQPDLINQLFNHLQNLSNRVFSQTSTTSTGYGYNNNFNNFSNYNTNYSSNFDRSRSQYQGLENVNPISGLSENMPTMLQQKGVNNYGAKYSTK